MKPIGNYQNRQVYWFDYDQFQLDQLPKKNWLCFATSAIHPHDEKFERFVRHAIKSGILEFKGHGQFGEILHDIFDEIMVDIEITKNTGSVDIATTFYDDETLADTFWQCFFATTLPSNTDVDEISIVCTDISGNDRSLELEEALERFKNGWIPD